jgi:hypothetical protein
VPVAVRGDAPANQTAHGQWPAPPLLAGTTSRRPDWCRQSSRGVLRRHRSQSRRHWHAPRSDNLVRQKSQENTYRHSRRAGDRGRRKIRPWRKRMMTSSPRLFVATVRRRRRRGAGKKKEKWPDHWLVQPRARCRLSPSPPRARKSPARLRPVGRALQPVTRKLTKLEAAPRRGERARPRDGVLRLLASDATIMAGRRRKQRPWIIG